MGQATGPCAKERTFICKSDRVPGAHLGFTVARTMLLANTFRAFRHRDYFVFWSGLFLGHTGTLIQTTAQSWLLFQLTNSPFYLGVEGFCLGLPRVIFSAFGGAVVDRAD